MKEWYNKTIREVLIEKDSNLNGLTESEAQSRIEKYGYNEFKKTTQISVINVFLSQFKSTLVLLLIFAACLSIYMHEYSGAGVIFVILIINAIIGTYHEYRAENAVVALEKMQTHEVTMIRNGKEEIKDAREVVPGDIILLHAGDQVPADGRIIEAVNLKIDESTLTGESKLVDKTCEKLNGTKPLAERSNMVYSNTFVSNGRGMFVVLATDDETEIGKIYRGITGKRELFPLQIKINKFSSKLGKAAIVYVILFTLFFGVLLGPQYGYDIGQILELSIAQAVSFIPEGLPIVVTISLAIGVSEMARKRAISRKLQAIETIGGVDVICVDKTGTLTLNKMSIITIVLEGKEYTVSKSTQLSEKNRPVEGMDIPGFVLLLKTGLLCNDSTYNKTAGKAVGESIETAIVNYAGKFALDKEKYSLAHPRKAEVSFDPKNKYMVTVNKSSQNEDIFHLKGSPEVVVKMCTRLFNGKRMTPNDRNEIINKTNKLASRGLRVIAFAYKPNQKKVNEIDNGYSFLGLIGFQDPLRPEVAKSVQRANSAGIKVIMITGDHKLTAETIAREAGIIHHESHKIVSGEEMEKMDDSELSRVVHDVRVFARVTGEHKARIVNILKNNKYIVAMTGDGVNDAIALKDANVGIALGSGTEVAKEAADIIITDDNFTSILDAVEEGRHSAMNLRKVIKFLFATNAIEVLFLLIIMLSPIWAGTLLPLALLPIHILYINLVTDGVCDVTLATERKDKHLMDKKPKDFSTSLFPKDVLKFIIVSSAVVLPSLFIVYIYYLNSNVSLEHMRTAVFTLLAFFQFWAAMNARTIMESVFSIGFFTNRYLTGAIVFSIIVQLLVIYLPELNGIMNTAPLNLFDWALIIIVSSTLFIVFELLKILERRGHTVLSG